MPDPTKPEIIVPLPRRSKLDLLTQQQIERLQNHSIVELDMVQQFHTWLDDKHQCRQACRVVGGSRTGKTVACNAYRHKHTDQRTNGVEYQIECRRIKLDGA